MKVDIGHIDNRRQEDIYNMNNPDMSTMVKGAEQEPPTMGGEGQRTQGMTIIVKGVEPPTIVGEEQSTMCTEDEKQDIRSLIDKLENPNS